MLSFLSFNLSFPFLIKRLEPLINKTRMLCFTNHGDGDVTFSYLQLLDGGVLLVHFEIVLCVWIYSLLSSYNLVQILLIDLIHGSLQVVPQTLNAGVRSQHTPSQG